MLIKKTMSKSVLMNHPTNPEMNFLYGIIFIGSPKEPSNHSRNVCIFAEGEVDRSPTGTGVSARAAIHYARGDIRFENDLGLHQMQLLNLCLVLYCFETCLLSYLSLILYHPIILCILCFIIKYTKILLNHYLSIIELCLIK